MSSRDATVVKRTRVESASHSSSPVNDNAVLFPRPNDLVILCETMGTMMVCDVCFRSTRKTETAENKGDKTAMMLMRIRGAWRRRRTRLYAVAPLGVRRAITGICPDCLVKNQR